MREPVGYFPVRTSGGGGEGGGKGGLSPGRYEREVFFSAFRKAFEGSWVKRAEYCLDEIVALPRADFEARVAGYLSKERITPGSRESWGYLLVLLEQLGAPPAKRAEVARQWSVVCPWDGAALSSYIRTLIESGRWEDAERVAFEALQGPAGEELRKQIFGGRNSSRFSVIPLDEIGVSPKPEARRPRDRPPLPGSGARARGARAPEKRPRPEAKAPEPRRPPRPPAPEEPTAEPAPLSFVGEVDSRLLEKLLRGPHDDLEALACAQRAAEILAEDRYDRLLSLSQVRGVEHMGYQIETVLRVLKRFRGRVLLADEVGLGKTIEACLVLKEYMLRGQVRRALILVPPALVGQWRGELEDKFGIAPRTTQDPEFRKDPEGFWKGGPVLLASLAIARSEAHRARILGERFDMVIIDEAHHLKNRSTRAWELANGLRSRFFLMLTATPVETNLTELYNLVTLLRPGTLGSERKFCQSFVRADDPTQPKDPEKLRELLREVMIRNTRARCGVLLPPRTARTLVVAPTPAEEELYRLVVEETRRQGLARRNLFRLLLEEAGSSPRAVAETASRGRAEADTELVSALARIEEAARAVRTTAKLERLPEILRGDKVLVFSRFRATMDAIAEELARLGILFAPFHGDMSAAEKDRAVEAFAGPGVDVLLCSEIGGEGRNLQFCHRLVNFDLPWNPMKIEQRIGRIHRIGQKETVEVASLACAGTAEERILQVLDQRVNLFELVIGEMYLILGDLTDEREFEDRVFDIYAKSRDDSEVEEGFETLTRELLEARGRLEKTKALDAALFGEDYET